MAGTAPHIPGCRDLSLIGERVARSLFTGHSDEIGGQVTVTVFPALSEGRTRADFDAAATTAQRLGAHPSVLTIHGWGHADDGSPWIITDPQPAESAESLLSIDGPLEVEHALQVGVLLAGALETAHRAGIVHGDLQPDRIVFGANGEPLLVETGLASFAVFPGLGALNNPVRYHSPPEVLERTEISPATDVYSLATTVYALLAGRAPHQKPAEVTDSNASLLLRILQMPLPPIERPDLPPGLESALRGPLSASAGKRPQQAIEVAWILQDVQRRAGLAITEPVVLDLDEPAGAGGAGAAGTPVGAAGAAAAGGLALGAAAWPPAPAPAPAEATEPPADVPTEAAPAAAAEQSPWSALGNGADTEDGLWAPPDQAGPIPADGATPPTLWPSTWPAENPPSDEPPSWAAENPPSDEPPSWAAENPPSDEPPSWAATPLTSAEPPPPPEPEPEPHPSAFDTGAPAPSFEPPERPPELDQLPAWYTDPLPNQGNGAGSLNGAASTATGVPGNGHADGPANGAFGGPADSGHAPLPRRRPGEAGQANGHIPPRPANGAGAPGQPATPWPWAPAAPPAPTADDRQGLPGAGDALRSLFGEVVGDPGGAAPPPRVAPSADLAADPFASIEARPLSPAPYPSSPGQPASDRWPPQLGPQPPGRYDTQNLNQPAATAAAPATELPRPDGREATPSASRSARPGPRQVAGLPTEGSDAGRPARTSSGPPALPVLVLIVVVVVLTLGVAWLIVTGDDGGSPATERTETTDADAGAGAGAGGSAAPTGLQVEDTGQGILVTWTGPDDGAYVVTVLSPEGAPQELPPSQGTSALIPRAPDAPGGICVTVAASTGGIAGPASEPACTVGATPDQMQQG